MIFGGLFLRPIFGSRKKQPQTPPERCVCVTLYALEYDAIGFISSDISHAGYITTSFQRQYETNMQYDMVYNATSCCEDH